VGGHVEGVHAAVEGAVGAGGNFGCFVGVERDFFIRCLEDLVTVIALKMC